MVLFFGKKENKIELIAIRLTYLLKFMSQFGGITTLVIQKVNNTGWRWERR